MKIITARELMDMPEGTIFSEAEGGVFDLCVKEKTVFNDEGEPYDFFHSSLLPRYIGGHYEGDFSNIGFEGSQRWALYERDFPMALYEEEDILMLQDVASDALKLHSKEPQS